MGGWSWGWPRRANLKKCRIIYMVGACYFDLSCLHSPCKNRQTKWNEKQKKKIRNWNPSSTKIAFKDAVWSIELVHFTYELVINYVRWMTNRTAWMYKILWIYFISVLFLPSQVKSFGFYLISAHLLCKQIIRKF